MALVQRTPQALEDLDEIWDFIAAADLRAADRVLNDLNRVFRLLADQQLMGELQPFLADGTYRRFPSGNYVIYYRPFNDGIFLLRVFTRRAGTKTCSKHVTSCHVTGR
jgi:plasmid stabilization system protein ParE